MCSTVINLMQLDPDAYGLTINLWLFFVKLTSNFLIANSSRHNDISIWRLAWITSIKYTTVEMIFFPPEIEQRLLPAGDSIS